MKVLDIPSSGSVNWRTASRNRNGQYIRNRSIPVQPRTSAQLSVRGFLVQASTAWKSLGLDDQTAWHTFGSLHPRTDSLGQSNGLTGEQAYVGVASTLQLLGLPIPTGAPPPEPDFAAFVPGAVTSADGVTLISGYANPASGRIMFWASRPASTGRRFFGQPIYLQASAPDATDPINITAQLAARWGTPASGSVIQIKQVPVVSGITGSPEVSQFIATGGPSIAAPRVTTDFTTPGGSGLFTYSVTTANIPSGVTTFQFQWKLTSDSHWQTTDALTGIADDGHKTGTVADSLAVGSYSCKMRWYSGSRYDLPSPWSTAITGINVT